MAEKLASPVLSLVCDFFRLLLLCLKIVGEFLKLWCGWFLLPLSISGSVIFALSSWCFLLDS